MYQKLRENAQKKFDSTGKGYGEALVYQGKLVSKLTTCQKTLEKCGGYVNIKEFNECLIEIS